MMCKSMNLLECLKYLIQSILPNVFQISDCPDFVQSKYCMPRKAMILVLLMQFLIICKEFSMLHILMLNFQYSIIHTFTIYWIVDLTLTGNLLLIENTQQFGQMRKETVIKLYLMISFLNIKNCLPKFRQFWKNLMS